jgi:hypothetical protein
MVACLRDNEDSRYLYVMWKGKPGQLRTVRCKLEKVADHIEGKGTYPSFR